MLPVEHNIQVYQGEYITLTIGCDSVHDGRRRNTTFTTYDRTNYSQILQRTYEIDVH